MRDFFDGNTYINHLLAEHHRLHKLVHHAAVDFRTRPAQVDMVGDLGEIRRELQRHFAEEEEGGCLEEAVSRCPRISPSAEHIKDEHPFLMQELDRLIARAKTLTEVDREDFVCDFADFCRRLHKHEAEENLLLQQGFGMAVNGDDAKVT